MKALVLLFVLIVCAWQKAATQDLSTIWTQTTYESLGLQFSPDDKYIIVQGYPNNTEVVETATGSTVFSKVNMSGSMWKKDGMHIIALQDNPNGVFIVTVETGTWKTVDSFLTTSNHFGFDVAVFSVSPDEQKLAVKVPNDAIAFYDLVTKKKIKEVKYYYGPDYPNAQSEPRMVQMVWSGNGKYLIYTAADGRLHFWDIVQDKIDYTYAAGYGLLRMNDDGSKIAFKTGKAGYAVQVMEVATKQIIAEIAGSAFNVAGISFSAKGSFLAIGWGGGSNLQVYQFLSRELICERKPGGFSVVSISHNGKYVVTNIATRLMLLNAPLAIVSVAEGPQIKQEESGVSIYPNPVLDIFKFSSPITFQGIVQIKIINSVGSIVKTLEQSVFAGNVEVSVHGIPSGSYTLVMSDEKKNYKIRFIKL